VGAAAVAVAPPDPPQRADVCELFASFDPTAPIEAKPIAGTARALVTTTHPPAFVAARFHLHIHLLLPAECAVLCCAVLCCAVLCCAVLCCAVLCGLLCCGRRVVYGRGGCRVGVQLPELPAAAVACAVSLRVVA
jgi:hypothetical protein